jgi:hypothetical protein
MLNRILNSAEQLASGVSQSRRGFLTSIGRLALGAGALAGILSLSGRAQAATESACIYQCKDGSTRILIKGSCGACPSRHQSCAYAGCRSSR